MNRLVTLAFVLAFSPLAAFAQHETIVVHGQETLSGLWKISFPAGVSGYIPGGGRFTTGGMESFCRLQQTGKRVSAVCFPGFGPDSGDGDLDGKDLHLAWGEALYRFVIDAKIESGSVRAFDGDFALKLFGIRHDAPTPASARRLGPDSAAPDTAGKAKLLTQTLEELAAGAILTPHVADVAFNFDRFFGFQANTPDEIRALGKVEAVLYLGEGGASAVFFRFPFSAYQVEFTNGQRLCGIHQRDDGVLDGFLCV